MTCWLGLHTAGAPPKPCPGGTSAPLMLFTMGSRCPWVLVPSELIPLIHPQFRCRTWCTWASFLQQSKCSMVLFGGHAAPSSSPALLTARGMCRCLPAENLQPLLLWVSTALSHTGHVSWTSSRLWLVMVIIFCVMSLISCFPWPPGIPTPNPIRVSTMRGLPGSQALHPLIPGPSSHVYSKEWGPSLS